ncbi:MAG: HEAT repeat domain-containing protein [Caldilinea sp.]
MSYASIGEALQVALSLTTSSQAREDAINYLESHREPEVIDALIALLETDDAGVRWKAADALAKMGKQALAPLLRALRDKSESRWLLEGASHIFHSNRDPDVARMTERLCAAMKGPGAYMATVAAAGELLVKLAEEGA